MTRMINSWCSELSYKFNILYTSHTARHGWVTWTIARPHLTSDFDRRINIKLFFPSAWCWHDQLSLHTEGSVTICSFMCVHLELHRWTTDSTPRAFSCSCQPMQDQGRCSIAWWMWYGEHVVVDCGGLAVLYSEFFSLTFAPFDKRDEKRIQRKKEVMRFTRN